MGTEEGLVSAETQSDAAGVLIPPQAAALADANGGIRNARADHAPPERP